ncbi:MAG: cadmium-translocating P-type ATPase, partial [Acholeplasmataceae bacterium]|nr:cadmium-translocating P-type ATPase [Acholeplasmataceae bacterium]
MTKRQLVFETISVILSILLIVAAMILSGMIQPEPWYVVLLFGLSFAIGGFAKAKEGILATVENKALNVEILMIMAALGAFIVGNYSEGAILILIFSISGLLESYASSKSEKALTSLLKLAPKTAILMVGKEEREVLVNDLKIKDRVVVKVGQQVPVDGLVVNGSSSVNQAAITGEFVPVFKDINDTVYAGSINIDSTMIVEATKDPKDSVVQKIIELVKSAQQDKTKSQSLINKIERYYVYIVILIAVFFMIVPPLFGWLPWHDAFYRGIIVLVVGSPCALMASIAPAMLSSLSNAAHHRILIKGGSHLENLIDINVVVFDKTGTITTGTPNVVRIEVSANYNREMVLGILYTLEKQSNHPLAKAVVEHLGSNYQLDGIESTEVSGRGMQGKYQHALWQIGRFESTHEQDIVDKMNTCSTLGHSLIPIIKNGISIGFVALMDTIRDDVKMMIDYLKKRNIKSVLLTGDNEDTAKSIAKEANIDVYESNCFPEDKVNKVKELQKAYGKVLMIGDGINDAPALATADIGVAMGTGTDVSLETADIIFMNDKLENLPRTLNLAMRMRHVTLQNVIFSITVITLLMISNVFGLIQLPFGVVAHETSTILVILNSLRLLFK